MNTSWWGVAIVLESRESSQLAVQLARKIEDSFPSELANPKKETAAANSQTHSSEALEPEIGILNSPAMNGKEAPFNTPQR